MFYNNGTITYVLDLKPCHTVILGADI